MRLNLDPKCDFGSMYSLRRKLGIFVLSRWAENNQTEGMENSV